jgi:hypothetical protein
MPLQQMYHRRHLQNHLQILMFLMSDQPLF